MLDYITYLAIQRRMTEEVQGVGVESAECATEPGGTEKETERPLRSLIGGSLRGLANRLDPMMERPAPAADRC